MFVGEAPGFHEDQQGYPFVGAAGKLLDRLLDGIGLTREDVYIANVLKCRPPGNRDPMPDEIEACETYLFRQISLIQPKLVATLGNFATKLLSGKQHGITRVHGQPQPPQVGGLAVTLYPLYHPAAALYTPAMLRTLEEDFARIPGLLAGADPAAAAPAPEALELDADVIPFPVPQPASRSPPGQPPSSSSSSRRRHAGSKHSAPTLTPGSSADARSSTLSAWSSSSRPRPRRPSGLPRRSPSRLDPGDVVLVSRRARRREDDVRTRRVPRARRHRPVTSPTFTIGHRYAGRVAVSHLDLYRFEACHEAEWGDLEPYFDDAIVFVEWPEAGAGAPAGRGASPPRARWAATGGSSPSRLTDDSLQDVEVFNSADSLRLTPPRTSRPARSCATGTCWARAAATVAALLPEVDRLARGGRCRSGERRRHRGRPRAGPLHEPAHGSRHRARARVRARRAGQRASRRSTRSPPAREARCRSSTPAGARSSRSTGPGLSAARAAPVERGRLCVGDGAVRYRDAARGGRGDGSAGRRSAPCPLGAPPRAARGLVRPGRAGRADLPAGSRRRQGARAGGGPMIELRRLTLVRPRRHREDRAALVPDAVVAVDVRRRAREAVVVLRRRLRPRSAQPRRLPDRLPLRRRLARHEPGRRRARTAAAGSRGGCSTTSSPRPRETRCAATRSRSASRTPARSSSTRRRASGRRVSGAATTRTTARTPT